MVEVSVESRDAGKKAHRFVRQLLPGVPLAGIEKMLRTGRVKRNGKRIKRDDVLAAGDRLQFYMAETDFLQSSREERKYGGVSREVSVIFEDDSILAVNKPAGLLVHGSSGEYKDTLVNRVQAWLYDRDGTQERRPADAVARDGEGVCRGAQDTVMEAAGASRKGVFVPAPIHRLDRNTSGIVIFAKTSARASALSEDIAQHRLRKWYLALVQGQLPASGVIELALAREPASNRTVVVEPGRAGGGKQARSLYVRKATAGGTSVAKVEIVSGRTHQIRAHFEQTGHPLWGDVKYGGRVGPDAPDQHQWLHAAWIELSDGLRLHAPLPDDYRAVLDRLGYTPAQVEEIERF